MCVLHMLSDIKHSHRFLLRLFLQIFPENVCLILGVQTLLALVRTWLKVLKSDKQNTIIVFIKFRLVPSCLLACIQNSLQNILVCFSSILSSQIRPDSFWLGHQFSVQFLRLKTKPGLYLHIDIIDFTIYK
jgi:hypothetical protein